MIICQSLITHRSGKVRQPKTDVLTTKLRRQTRLHPKSSVLQLLDVCASQWRKRKSCRRCRMTTLATLTWRWVFVQWPAVPDICSRRDVLPYSTTPSIRPINTDAVCEFNQLIGPFLLKTARVISANVRSSKMLQKKDRWNRKVFCWCWNESTHDVETTLISSAFQILVAATGKALHR